MLTGAAAGTVKKGKTMKDHMTGIPISGKNWESAAGKRAARKLRKRRLAFVLAFSYAARAAREPLRPSALHAVITMARVPLELQVEIAHKAMLFIAAPKPTSVDELPV